MFFCLLSSLPSSCFFLQANIEQAKKEWELSHLQHLREQEERQAREEEEEEAMCLTYDRPEMINKVVLKRRHSTGTWEVILHPDSSRSPSQASTRSKSSSSVKVPVAKSSVDRRSVHSSSSADFGVSLSPTESRKPLQMEKQLIPICQNMKFSKKSRVTDPDYDPASESGKKSKHSKTHRCTLSLGGLVSPGSSPVVSIQPALPCSIPMTNHCSPSSENVSSRTRLKQVQTSPNLSQPDPKSPNQSNPKSPNHRYPIRNKQ